MSARKKFSTYYYRITIKLKNMINSITHENHSPPHSGTSFILSGNNVYEGISY